MSIRRRVGHLEDAATVLLFCRDPWHNSEAARFAVVYEDMDSGETPAPPSCPTCNAPPDLTITVGYEREAWRRLNDVSELRRTSIEW